MKMFLLGAANPEAVRMLHIVKRSQPNVDFAFLDNDPRKQGTLFYGAPVVVGNPARIIKTHALPYPDARVFR